MCGEPGFFIAEEEGDLNLPQAQPRSGGICVSPGVSPGYSGKISRVSSGDDTGLRHLALLRSCLDRGRLRDLLFLSVPHMPFQQDVNKATHTLKALEQSESVYNADCSIPRHGSR